MNSCHLMQAYVILYPCRHDLHVACMASIGLDMAIVWIKIIDILKEGKNSYSYKNFQHHQTISVKKFNRFQQFYTTLPHFLSIFDAKNFIFEMKKKRFSKHANFQNFDKIIQFL